MFPRRNACSIAHHWFCQETFIQLALHIQRMISGRQWRSVSSGQVSCTPRDWWDGLQTASPFPWNQYRYTKWPAVLRVTLSGKCFLSTLRSYTTQWRIKFAPIAPVHFVIAPAITRSASAYCVSTTQLQSLTGDAMDCARNDASFGTSQRRISFRLVLRNSRIRACVQNTYKISHTKTTRADSARASCKTSWKGSIFKAIAPTPLTQLHIS